VKRGAEGSALTSRTINFEREFVKGNGCGSYGFKKDDTPEYDSDEENGINSELYTILF
jgi:hypothetical protein